MHAIDGEVTVNFDNIEKVIRKKKHIYRLANTYGESGK